METTESLGAQCKPRIARKLGPQLVAMAEQLSGAETAVCVARARKFHPSHPDMDGVAVLTESRLIVSLVGGGRAVVGSYTYGDTPYLSVLGDVATVGPMDLVIVLSKEMCRELGQRVKTAGGRVL